MKKLVVFFSLLLFAAHSNASPEQTVVPELPEIGTLEDMNDNSDILPNTCKLFFFGHQEGFRIGLGNVTNQSYGLLRSTSH